MNLLRQVDLGDLGWLQQVASMPGRRCEVWHRDDEGRRHRCTGSIEWEWRQRGKSDRCYCANCARETFPEIGP